MKKLVIAILIAIIIIIGIFIIANSNRNISKVLAQFETYESDGYYDNKNNEEAAGYIVSNKTQNGYQYGYVNYKGKILLDVEYDQIYRVMDIEDKNKIYLIAEKNGRYGVNLNGKDIIKYEYQFIEYNNKIEGFILQRTDNYGVANINGKIIIPVENESVEVKGQYIYVSSNQEDKVFDKNGNIKDIDFNTSINPTENENYFIKVTETDEQYFYGVVDKEEKELIKTQYTYIEYLFDNFFIVCDENNKEGIIDTNNNIKLEFNYSLIQKIQDTNLIMTINNETSQTEIYSENFEKICTMKNANIENDGNTIKIYNEVEIKYFDKNGTEINK